MNGSAKRRDKWRQGGKHVNLPSDNAALGKPAGSPGVLAYSLRFLAIGLALFAARILFMPDIPDVSPETCHSGAIASELLDHGIRFPLLAYTPESYENGIIVEGFLTVPFFQLFGRNLLALKLLAHVFATVSTLMGFALLERALDWRAVRDGARSLARWCYFLLMVLAPSVFTFKMLDALGDHNEGTALAMVLLVLLVRRIERPTTIRLVALWLTAGIFAVWERGTLMVVLIAGLHELTAAARSRALWTRPFLAVGLFLIGYAPGFYISIVRGFSDAEAIAGKFSLRSPFLGIVDFLTKSWIRPLFVFLFLGACVDWMATGWRQRRDNAVAMCLAGFALLHVVLVGLTGRTNGFYHLYSFFVMAIPPAIWSARLGNFLSHRFALPLPATGLMLSVVLVLGLRPELRLDLGRLQSLHRDDAQAACYWRFGRAFGQFTHDPAAAAKLCRSLGTGGALECMSGLAYASVTAADAQLQSSEERLALSFGYGRSECHGSRQEHPCASLSAPEERHACESGSRWECLFFLDMERRVLDGRLLSRPTCDVSVPFVGFESRVRDRWFARQVLPGPAGPVHDRNCQAILAPCLGRVAP